ncbi:hypothetical protein [Nocardia colli]|uniref:hypothetical protein n=1 Tax=Nocardia colli TaxID=2545717 RepID=UPI0035E069A0
MAVEFGSCRRWGGVLIMSPGSTPAQHQETDSWGSRHERLRDIGSARPVGSSALPARFDGSGAATTSPLKSILRLEVAELPQAGIARGSADVEPWPSGLPCVRVHQVRTALDFYLSLGCDVHLAADGWVVLRIGAVHFALAGIGRHDRQPASSYVLVWTSDLAALCRHLHGAGARITSCAIAGGSVLAVGPAGCNLVIKKCCAAPAVPPASLPTGYGGRDDD